jgi:hypothetical protein
MHACLVSQPHEAEIELIRQNHDASPRDLFSYLPDNLRHAPGVLAGLDDHQGGL